MSPASLGLFQLCPTDFSQFHCFYRNDYDSRFKLYGGCLFVIHLLKMLWEFVQDRFVYFHTASVTSRGLSSVFPHYYVAYYLHDVEASS